MGSREEKRGLSRRYIIGEGASHINCIYGSLSTLFLFPVNIYYMILSLRDSEVKKTVKVSLYPRASCTQCRRLVCNRQARVVALCLKEGGHNVYFVMRAMIYPVALRTPLRAQPSSCREDRAHTICYLSALTPPIPGPARVPFGGEQMDREVGDEGLGGGVVWRAGEPWKPTRQRVGGLSVASVPHPSQSQVEEPVSCLPLEPLPGPDMKCCWQIFVLCISLMLILWLMAPCLDLKPESAPHEKWMKVVPWRCSCPPFKFRKYGCPSGTLNDSVSHHTAGGNWFDVVYEKTMGHLMGAAEPTSPDAVLSWSGMNSASELGRVWEKLFKVIPRTLVSHFDLFCGTCASVGNSKILWAASLGKSANHTAVSRMNQVPIQGFEMLGNQTTGQSVSLQNDRDQGSWRQLDLLLLKLFVLAWTSDALSEEILEDGPVP
ncbi:uncharacterized protein C20orf173 homolog isoform X3 [Orcinus orca]|uniref:uncharacterized protein C20orf173 homolog isoform X3 n=1 Tax=Orcinus orca TaxID=9733 RepID=UPI002111E2DE|nr:uncharacterized protein C20orf173 homolog isoform X3 [Orcinus orca]